MSKLFGVWLLLLAAIASPAIQAQPLQALSTESKEPLALTVEWCATAADLTFDAMLAQGCGWQPLDTSSVIRGWDKRVFWLRLSLHNPSADDVERWLEVGHPYMAQISLYLEGTSGRQVRHIGYLTPMDERGVIESTYGVLPIYLAGHQRQTAWVRLSSDTIISLFAQLWEPDEFRNKQQLRQFGVSLGIGGMALVVVFSLMMWVLTRQVTYGFFALGQIGLFLVVSVTRGAFQQFFWPHSLPMTKVVSEMGTLIVVIGLYHFLRAFLPQLHRYPVLLYQFRVAVSALALVILAGLSGLSGLSGLHVLRSVLTVLCGSYAVLLCVRAWRDGDRAAGIIVVAFISVLSFTVMRLLVVAGLIPFSPELSLLPLLSIFMFSPLMLLGLVDRTRQLQEEITRVRAESAAQLRFLAQMSHELRSPLDIVLGNAQLLSREARSREQVSGLNSIFDSGRQLLRIIDHILDYARGAAGMLKIEPAPLRLSTFLRGIERMARLLAIQRNNRFDLVLTGEPQALQALTVKADAERLRQVLGNLLANAARHTSDGLIALKVNALPPSREPHENTEIQLEFTVSDTGEGISVEEQERIFRPFERADSQFNYRNKGAGLGLAIARQLVELMGGRLRVISAPEQGAQFVFTVPVQRLAEQAAPSVDRLDGFDAAGYQGPRRTVLVVDDEAVGRSVLCQLLQSLGFEVLQAGSGHQAAALIAQGPALDMVLTDQYMPDGDGWLVLERVAEFMPRVPVVMISAASPSPPPNWSGRLRFAAEFLRPIDHAQLLASIGDILDLHWIEHTEVLELNSGRDAAAGDSAQAQPAMALPETRYLQDLAKLVELGQVTAIEEWVRTLQAKQPEYAPLAAHVLEAVHRLDLQGLATFLSAQIEAADSRR